VKKQAAHTLIEVCVAMALLSAMMALAAGIVHGLMGANRVIREGLEQQSSLAALAEAFRNDVHASVDLRGPAGDGAQQWEMTLPDGAAIVYRLERDSLLRQTKSLGQSTSQDFALPKGATVAIETRRQGEATLTTLLVTPPATAAGAPGRPGAGLRVEALLARDQRLAAVPSPTATANPEEGPANE